MLENEGARIMHVHASECLTKDLALKCAEKIIADIEAFKRAK
jgi:hypothetical protein